MDLNLHDYPIASLTVDWKAGTLIIDFQGTPRASLLASCLRELHLPRWEEWGPSICVNDVTVTERADGLVHLSMEMQSGDVIEIVAATLDFTGAT